MHLKTTRLVLLGLVILILSTPLAFAAAAHKRVVDDNDTVPVKGNVHPLAQPRFDVGPTDQNLQFARMILVVLPRAGSKDTIDGLLAQQNNPNSPLYHQWLTPDQFGKRFGVSDDDLADVTAWLQRGGFSIEEVGRGRTTIIFSGTVGQVERTFKTQIHDYKIYDKVYHANATDPQIPRALVGLVGGVVTLHNFPKHPLHHDFHPVTNYTSGTSHFIAPADFAKIYNTQTLYSGGTNGSGKTICIVGRTDIQLADVQYFRSFFGLPANDPVFVHNGTDPGDLGSGEETEADLDVEWSGATAPNATVKFVISASTSSTDGVDLSAQYIVNNNLGDVMSTSFGQCESSMGSTENTFYNNTWSQAATQGISAFVSSGDSGAAGCDSGSATSGTGQAVSGLASTPYDIAVGGSQFNDTASPSTYWSSTNNSSNQSSVLSYIPEIAWNESGNVSGGSGLWSSSGGVSTIYAKPSWQSCVGVPADGKRDVPDVCLTAAGHDGYLIIQGHTSSASGLSSVGGTSAASPSFAGLMALVVQKYNARQGNANTKFYSLANSQYASSGTVIFHDITSGNNSVPGVTGFNCGTGYDLVTGVGSVDANSMVNNWNGSATPDFSISASPTSVTITQGSSGTSTITTSVSGGFSNAISLSSSGAPAGTTVSFNPSSIAAPGSGTSTMTITVGSSTTAGTYTITATGTGGSTTHSTNVTLTVNPSGGGGTVVTNGGFETGNFSGWTTSGVAAVNTAAKHSGTYGAQLGNGSPSTDSTAVQTFTLPSNATQLSFWYANTCPDTVTYDWATATVKDNVTGTTTTILGKTCTASAVWTQVTWNASASAGHSVTLTLTNHDDNYPGDPTFTYYDDVAVATSGGGGDTTAPTVTVTAPSNGATVSGTVTITASASDPDNPTVSSMQIFIDGTQVTSNANSNSISYSWNTTTASNGSHTIVAKASDAAGNVGTSSTTTVTVSNSVTTTQLLGNPGFESGANPAPWTTTAGVPNNSTAEPAHSGSWDAWLDGYGTTHTDTIMQQVAIPSGKTSATLTFWLHIDTAETTTTTAFDTLQVQIRNSSGTVLATLATYSNLNAASGYTQKSFNLNSYIGQTIQVYLVGSEDSSLQTSFVVDDFALNVQ